LLAEGAAVASIIREGCNVEETGRFANASVGEDVLPPIRGDRARRRLMGCSTRRQGPTNRLFNPLEHLRQEYALERLLSAFRCERNAIYQD
jgi:hypothetical protein